MRTQPVSVPDEFPPVGRQLPGKALEERCFSGAIGPDQAEDFAAADREGHVCQCAYGAIGLRQVANLDRTS